MGFIMSQEYSNPEDANNPHKLPDIEIFSFSGEDTSWVDEDGMPMAKGYYWWACSPGCLPESDWPFGPFETYELALADARGE